MWELLLSVILKPIAKTIGKYFGKVFKRYLHHKATLPEAIRRTQVTRTLMAEARVLFQADRVAIFQFHNGGIFSNRNPQWRVSCTDDLPGPGVLSVGVDSQAIFASRMIDMVGHLFDQNHLPTHVRHLRTKDGRSIFVLAVGEMEQGFSKVVLENQGVDYFVQAPIFDQDNCIFGYVTMDFCSFGRGPTLTNVQAAWDCLRGQLPRASEYVSRIEFSITNKGTPLRKG
jgi:hypothetical protein